MIERDSINEAWSELLYQLYNVPDHQPAPRGLKTNERLGVSLRVTDLRNNVLFNPTRNINYLFMVAEWLWIAYERDDVATLKQYNSQLARFSDNGITLAGAYGPRLGPQWPYVVNSVLRDYFSRQAVATIWSPRQGPSKDVPCTLSFQVIARDGKLNGIVTMRSSDVWLGLPYDFFTFSQLVNCLAGVLGLRPGFLQFNLGSSHLYETDFTKAKAVLDDPMFYHHRSLRSPALPYWPERNLISQPVSLQDVLLQPKKFVDHHLPYPWALYADVLNSGSWGRAREILAEAHD